MVRTGRGFMTEHGNVQLQYCVCPVSGSEWAGFDLLAVSLPGSLVALLLTVRHLGRPSRAIKKVSCVRERWILGQDVLVHWDVETVGLCMLCLSFSGGKKTMWIKRRRQTVLLQSMFLFMDAFKELFFFSAHCTQCQSSEEIRPFSDVDPFVLCLFLQIFHMKSVWIYHRY